MVRLRVGLYCLHNIGQQSIVPGPKEESRVAVLDKLGNASYGACYNGKTARETFENGESDRLLPK